MARKIISIVSWGMVLLALVSVVLALRKPSAPSIATSAEAARSFDAKVAQLAQVRVSGAPRQIRITESELNSKLQEGLRETPPGAGGAPSMEAATIHLAGDGFVGTFRMSVRGVGLYLTLGGTLRAVNGQLQFTPRELKLGSLPLPIITVQSVLRAKLDSPEMRDRLRLPESIKDVRIENGELVLQAK
jgi:uncharacterized protein YpmS